LWIFRINVGAFANIFAYFISIRVFKWDTENSFRGIWKQASIGCFFTFLAMFFTNKDVTTPTSILFLAISVIIITIIVYVFLFQFGFFSRPLNTTSLPPVDYLFLKDSERVEKIDIRQVSFIKVEDHYCTVVYQKEQEWQEWTVYEKLKNFEEKHQASLVRINRSTLVNPQWVEKIEKNKGKHLIHMKCKNSASFPLSSSQQHLLDHLIPVIEAK